MKTIQSPNLASHRASQLHDRSERGRKAKEHDRNWQRTLSNMDAHKQRMSGQHLQIISGRHRQKSQRDRMVQGRETATTIVERTMLLNALWKKQESDNERATTAAEESAEQRHRRQHEHREYLARLRQEAVEREEVALRAIALKDEASRLAQERAQEMTRQKVARSAEERKAYEGQLAHVEMGGS